MVVTVQRNQPIGVSQLSLGVTHTEQDLTSADPRARVRAAALLASSSTYQDQAIMGWGVDNPEPSPGEFSWASLDNRMQLIQSTGGIPVITLCGAPDWMKGGNPGATNWSGLNDAPTPDHYADFANLAKAVAERYPQVKYYQVWNEMKGFWSLQKNRWDYEDYTTLYNDVYDALKAVSPTVQVGGPYVAVNNQPDHQGDSDLGNAGISGPYGSIDPRTLDVLTYWLANKHGADFVAVDGMSYVDPSQPFAAGQGFADMTVWLRSETDLPVWWAEWYATPWGGPEYSDDEQNAVMTDALGQMMVAGASVALRWQPQASVGRDDESMWTATQSADGGQALPFYYSAKALHDDFQPGTALYKAESSTPQIEVLASGKKALAINKTNMAVTVGLGKAVKTLPPYGVMLLQ